MKKFYLYLAFCLTLIILLIPLSGAWAETETIELQDDELARESVLPVFDKSVSVKNRLIVTDKRFEGALYYGWAMSEPIFNVSKVGVGGYYHFTEEHSLGLIYAKNFSGLSSYAEQLGEKDFNLDFNRAPNPQYSLLVDYNLNAFYGKMSFAKHLVVNTTTLFSGTIGMINYVHKTYPAVALGLGEKIYVTKNLSIRFDLRMYIYQAPVPFLKNYLHKETASDPADPVPSYDKFSDRINYTNNLDIGLNYLF